MQRGRSSRLTQRGGARAGRCTCSTLHVHAFTRFVQASTPPAPKCEEGRKIFPSCLVRKTGRKKGRYSCLPFLPRRPPYGRFQTGAARFHSFPRFPFLTAPAFPRRTHRAHPHHGRAARGSVRVAAVRPRVWRSARCCTLAAPPHAGLAGLLVWISLLDLVWSARWSRRGPLAHIPCEIWGERG
jgi:hypothetical protein